MPSVSKLLASCMYEAYVQAHQSHGSPDSPVNGRPLPDGCYSVQVPPRGRELRPDWPAHAAYQLARIRYGTCAICRFDRAPRMRYPVRFKYRSPCRCPPSLLLPLPEGLASAALSDRRVIAQKSESCQAPAQIQTPLQFCKSLNFFVRYEWKLRTPIAPPDGLTPPDQA